MVDPTSVDINQWIKVKNKYSGKLFGENLKNSSKSNSALSTTNAEEMESNGFKLISSQSGDRNRRNSNLDSVTKDFDSMTLNNVDGGKNVPSISIIQKGILRFYYYCYF